MKKLLLPVIFLTSFLFSGCLNLGNIFGLFYLGYDFVNIENKKVKYIGEVRPYSEALIIDDILFDVGLERDWDRLRKGVEYWRPIFVVNTSNIYINKKRYDVRSTGLIDYVIKTDRDGDVINANANYITVDFNGIPIKHKKIKILYDVSIKCITGETITINREFTGYLKLKVTHFSWEELFWYPSV